MNDYHYIVYGRKIFIALFFVIAIVAVVLAPKSAVNVDEQLHYPHAKRVVNWYFSGGEDASSLETPVTNLKYYGQSVDNLTALINRVFNVNDEFLARHYTGAFFFMLLLLLTGLLQKEITGSYLMASITVLAIICMPRLSGQAFGNLKDIPFAAGYVAGTLFILRSLKAFPLIPWKTVLLLGSSIAFTVSVRAGGFILFAYLGLVYLSYFAFKPAYFIRVLSNRAHLTRLAAQGITVVVTGYFAGLIFWPYALQDVITHPLESLRVMEHYKVSIRQVFEGKLLWSTDLPWYYLLKWFLISTPVLLLCGFFIYITCFIRNFFINLQINRETLAEAFVLFTFIFPFVYVIVIDSNLYSGIRQMLFILPVFAILAAVGLYRFLLFIRSVNRLVSYVAAVLAIILLILPLNHSVKTFPADYIYFNSLAGGNKKAWGKYEYDYYFHSIKEAAEYLMELLNEDEKVVVAMNNNLDNYYSNQSNIKTQYSRYLERSTYDWDYGIFGLNYMEPDFLKGHLWKEPGIIKTFYHSGNPVAIIIKRIDKSDFNGISEIKSGNLQSGIKLIEKALEEQPNNVWLHVNIARAFYKLGDTERFLHYIERGKEILPMFEPLLLLESEYYFNQGESDKAEFVLGKLLEINPRYLPAQTLLEKAGSEI